MALDAAEITQAHNFATAENVCVATFLGTEVAEVTAEQALCPEALKSCLDISCKAQNKKKRGSPGTFNVGEAGTHPAGSWRELTQ